MREFVKISNILKHTIAYLNDEQLEQVRVCCSMSSEDFKKTINRARVLSLTEGDRFSLIGCFCLPSGNVVNGDVNHQRWDGVHIKAEKIKRNIIWTVLENKTLVVVPCEITAKNESGEIIKIHTDDEHSGYISSNKFVFHPKT